MFNKNKITLTKNDLNLIIKSLTLDDVFDKNKLSVTTTKDNAYKTSIWVYVCTNLISRNIARIPINIYKNNNLVENQSDEVVKLFKYVNPFLNNFQLFEGTQIYKLLKGNSYWHLITNGRKIFEIELLDPDKIKIIVDNSGGINNYQYRVKGGYKTIDKNEILHFKYFNPFDAVYGFTPITLAMLSITPESLSREYVKKLYENYGQVGGVIEVPDKMDDVYFERLKKQFELRHKGVDNAGKIAILENNMKYKETKLTLTDLQFIEQRKLTKSEIHAIFNVNMGLTGDTSQYNRSNMQDIKKDFWIQNLLPEMSYIEDVINSNMFIHYYQGYKFEFDKTKIEALQNDINTLVDSATKLFNMGFTGNEINKRLSLGFDDEKDWRNKWWIPFSMQPADSSSSKSLKAQKDIQPENDRQQQEYIKWKSIQSNILPIEKTLNNKLKRFWFELRKISLSNINNKSVKEYINPPDLYDYDNELKKLEKTILPYTLKSIDTGGSNVIDDLGLKLDFDLYDEKVLDYIKNKKIEIKGIFDTVDNQISNDVNSALQEGITQGLSENEIKNNIENIIKDVTTQAQKRSQTISRTEVNTANNFGRFSGMKQSGIQKVEWIQSFDDRVRDIHRISQTVTFGDEFTTGLKYPGDPTGSNSTPGNIINCRCTLGAVAE